MFKSLAIMKYVERSKHIDLKLCCLFLFNLPFPIEDLHKLHGQLFCPSPIMAVWIFRL